MLLCVCNEKKRFISPFFSGLVSRVVVAAVNPTLGPLQLQQQNNLRRRAAEMQKAEIFFGLRSRTRSHTRFSLPPRLYSFRRPTSDQKQSDLCGNRFPLSSSPPSSVRLSSPLLLAPCLTSLPTPPHPTPTAETISCVTRVGQRTLTHNQLRGRMCVCEGEKIFKGGSI